MRDCEERACFSFVTAGAGSVIGTLWEIADEPAREISVAFHRELREGSSPAAALRTAQTEMIRRGAPPSVWVAWQLYGSGL